MLLNLANAHLATQYLHHMITAVGSAIHGYKGEGEEIKKPPDGGFFI